MDIEFISEQQSLQTLCFHYIQNQTPKSRTLLLNSILLQLVSQPEQTLYTLFTLCMHIVDENRVQGPNTNTNTNTNGNNNSRGSRSVTEKEYYRNLAVLVREVVGKYPGFVGKVKMGQLEEIVGVCCREALCAVAGNDFISLLTLLLQKTSQHTPEIDQQISQMLHNPKMHIGSYRQATRHNLYTLLLKTLQAKPKPQLKTAYLQRIITSIQDEKDPRNISVVFQIYLYILNYSPEDQIIGLRGRIFQALEMYYPIDFEGDAEEHGIRLADIRALLDQCLTHPCFVKELRTLLMVKMGAAPIGKYISTFIATRSHPVTPESLNFWSSLLTRTCQQQYLQQQYPQSSEYTLSNLTTQLLTRLIPQSKPIPLIGYTAVLEWLQKFLKKNIFEMQENSKYANLVIVTLRDIMRKCCRDVGGVVGAYAVGCFVEGCRGRGSGGGGRERERVGDVVYQLGVLVPVLEVMYDRIDTQKIGLLILSLTQIFHTSIQPHPKLIVLKLLMLLSRSPSSHKMINQTNILQSCLQVIASGTEDAKIVKAYIDFVVEVYGNEDKVRDCIVHIGKLEVRMYGMLTLAMKVGDERARECFGVVGEMLNRKGEHYQQYFKQLLTNLKLFKPQPTLKILSSFHLPLSPTEPQSLQLTNLITQKSSQLDLQTAEDMIFYLAKYAPTDEMLYLSRNVWRPFLVDEGVARLVGERLRKWVEEKGEEGEGVRARLLAFFNKSANTFGKGQYRVEDQAAQEREQYKEQLYSMLPIEKTHNYSTTPAPQLNWPTLIHYIWQNSKSLRIDLIEHLPTSILASESNKILPTILAQEDICTLAKILSGLPEDIVVGQIVPFVVRFLERANEETQGERVVACNKVLYELEARAKEEEGILAALMKNKGRILVAIQENLLQHRKRRARQSSRTIFSLYNSLK